MSDTALVILSFMGGSCATWIAMTLQYKYTIKMLIVENIRLSSIIKDITNVFDATEQILHQLEKEKNNNDTNKRAD